MTIDISPSPSPTTGTPGVTLGIGIFGVFGGRIGWVSVQSFIEVDVDNTMRPFRGR
jgi:hypothetical protein